MNNRFMLSHRYYSPVKWLHACMLVALLFITICGNAQETNKKINIDLPAQSLEATLKLLEEKAGIVFIYESSQLKSNMIKAHSYNNANVPQILTDILEDTGLSFAENGNTIIIKKSDIVRKGKTLSGYVEDASNSERLIGVSV